MIRKKQKTGDITVKKCVYLCLKILLGAIVASIMIYPFWWMITGSFKSMYELASIPPTFLPGNPTLENFKVIFGKIDIMGKMYINSLIVAVCIPILQTCICLPAAYAFAKLRFPCKNILFMLFMGAMMIPGQLTIITNYQTMIQLKLINHLGSLILLGVFSALCIFMMKQFFMTIPKNLEEAGKIDGCTIFGAFIRIAVPLAKPIIAVNLILCFNAAWGDFFTPMIMLKKIGVMTLPIGMTVLQGAYSTQSPSVVVAALTMSIIPVMIVFFVFRDKLILGIASSGLKL